MEIAHSGSAGAAAAGMVLQHAPVLAAETGWDSVVELRDAALVWRVTVARNAAQIEGLTVFGLMALGGHHPAQHLMIAQRPGH